MIFTGKSGMEAYRAEVASVFSSVAGASVFNGTLEHACVVTEEALRAAEGTVNILLRSAPSFQFDCNGAVEAVEDYLARPHAKLRVLHEEGFDPERSPFARAVMQASPTRVQVRHVPDAVQDRYAFNFLTVDGRAFRYQEERSLPVAVVAAGEKHVPTARRLDLIFEQLWGMSDATEAPEALRELA